MRIVVSSTRSTDSSGRSYSSSISPTISSSRSSSVTMPRNRAVLVDHDRHVLVRPAELGQQRREVLRLGDDVGGPQDRADVDLGEAAVVHGGEQVAHVQHAGDVVERLAEDRVARVRRVDHGGQTLVGRQVDRERHHLRPRHHHLADLLVGEVEDLVEHLLLRRRDLAGVLGARDDLADLLLGVDELADGRRTEAEEAHDRVRGHLQRPDERPRGELQQRERIGDRHRVALGLLESDRLGRELAERDAQVGEDQERDREGEPCAAASRSSPRGAARRRRRARCRRP